MKKYLFTIISLAALFSFVGCNKETGTEESEIAEIPFEIIASAGLESKTTNDNLNTNWAADDVVNLLHSITGTNDYINDGEFRISAENLSSNKFSGSLSGHIIQGRNYDWYMFYPYNISLSSPDNTSQAAYTLGAKINAKQVQSGNDSKAHLAGKNFPLFGMVSNVPSDEIPNITMTQLASVVEVEVTNELEEDITVTGVDFIASESLIGLYYIGGTATGITYTPVSGAVSDTAKLSVNGGAPLQKTQSSKFYIGIRPFTAAAGSNLTVKVWTSSSKGPGLHKKVFTLSKDYSFSAGRIKTVKVLYNTPIVKDEVLWAENWDSGKSGDKPSVYNQGSATVYGGGKVTYSESGTTKLYSKLDPINSINLLLGKGKGTFTVSNIPTAGAMAAVLTFNTNHNKPNKYVLSSTSGLTISGPDVSGSASPFTVTYNITIPQGVETFDLIFTNSNSSNVRIDDIHLVGRVSSIGAGGSTPGGGETPGGGDTPGGDEPGPGAEPDPGSSPFNSSWLELPAKSDDNPNYHYVTHRANMKGSLQRNYSLLYDDSKYTSYWVAYPLCRSHLGSGRDETWGFDPLVSSSLQTSVNSGYGAYYEAGNFFARGHQIPNADRNGVMEMMHQTYYSTNMTPQAQHSFNGGIWSTLEERVRGYVPSNDTLYVVTGASFNKVGESLPVRTIVNKNDNKTLPVPNYYWKVILKVRRTGGTVTAASAIGYWLKHEPTSSSNLDSFACSVDNIEQYTGFNFFVNLSSDLQAAAERNSDISTFAAF